MDSKVISQSSSPHNSCNTFHSTIEFIGKRWTGVIIYHLLDGPKRYFELAEEIPGISDRLLTERLRELETQDFILKKTSGPGTRKVEYELTDMGKETEEIIQAIVKWVRKHGCASVE